VSQPDRAHLDPDVQLMLRFQAGDEAAFRILFERHLAPLVGFLTRGLRSRQAAEDVAQEVFVRVYRYRDRYRPDASFRTFLYRVARNAMLNALRRPRVEAGAEDPGAILDALTAPDDPERSLLEDEAVRRVTVALLDLPERQRTAVVLTRYQGLAYEEAAAVLDVRVQALKSLLNRARVALAQEVEA